MTEEATSARLTDASVRRRVILVYYGLCLAVAVYVGIYMMLWHRGYQKIDTIRGTVHSKIKGSATGGANLDPALAGQSWDAEDLVRYYTDGFFMPTTFHRTTQTQGKCSVGARSHLKTLKGHWTEKCSKEGHECQAGTHTFHGLQTGKCVTDGRTREAAGEDAALGLIGACVGGAHSGASCFGDGPVHAVTSARACMPLQAACRDVHARAAVCACMHARDARTRQRACSHTSHVRTSDDAETCGDGGGTCEGAFCELQTWCPPEGANPNATATVHLEGWQNFSVFARIDTIFPQFDRQLNNLRQAGGRQGLCPLPAAEEGGCEAANLFSVQDVLDRAQVSASEAADHGAEILVKVKWADSKPLLGRKNKYPCNLDAAGWAEACAPSFAFRRLDDPDPDSFSHGFNFREVVLFSLALALALSLSAGAAGGLRSGG